MTYMRNLAIYILGMSFFMFSCKEEPVLAENGCEEIRTVNKTFDTTPAHEVIEAVLEGDCLELTYSYGGGCKEVDSYLLHKSDESSSVAQLKLDVRDDDDCEALITETHKYDLTSLQGNDSRSLELTIETVEEPITYTW